RDFSDDGSVRGNAKPLLRVSNAYLLADGKKGIERHAAVDRDVLLRSTHSGLQRATPSDLVDADQNVGERSAQTFERDIERILPRLLVLVKHEAVKSVHDDRHAGEPRRDPTENARF